MPQALTRGFDNLNQVIEFYARTINNAIATHQHEDDKQLAGFIDLVALRLLDTDLKKGDVVATQLVLIPEHIILMCSCLKFGVIIALLDLRLKPEEVVRVKHSLFDEGIFAFVKFKINIQMTFDDMHQYCKLIASYKRPQHIELWKRGTELPLTQSIKVDKLTLKKLAIARIEQL